MKHTQAEAVKHTQAEAVLKHTQGEALKRLKQRKAPLQALRGIESTRKGIENQ